MDQEREPVPPGGEAPGVAKSGERSETGRAEPGTSPPRGRGAPRRRFTREQKAAILADLEQSGEPVAEFAAKRGLSGPTVYTWRSEGRTGPPEAVRRGSRTPKSSKKPAPRSYTGDERRQAVEAYLKAGMPVKAFARLYGIADKSLAEWLRRYRSEGPAGLEDQPRGRKKGGPGGKPSLPEATKSAIRSLKDRFPLFGLRKIRDFLHRFQAIKVSANGVRKTLKEAGVEPAPKAPPKPRPRKAKPKPFYRASPNQMWQSDITELWLTRHRQKVYLVVFLDDRSRYVVSFGLHTHAKSEMVQEALLDGIARFGKPEEVLTDQGPQYFSWRGKSAFQKLLIREGIRHVVARSHHPQTVGKCERFWETVKSELWDRAHPQDLVEARERLNHFIAHYNHFRPHQGIDGLVPADHFFKAEDAVRKTIEAKLARNEINLALDAKPRKSVYLFGQVGDECVSLHGEGGRIVIQTPSGERREMALDELGGATRTSKEQKDDEHDGNDDDHDDDGAGAAAGGEPGGGGPGDAEASHAALPEADEVPARAEDGVPGQVAVGRGEPAGAGAGAPRVHGAARALAREGDEGAGDGASAAAGAAAVAAVAAGSCGYGGGALAPAEEAGAEGRNADAESGQRSEAAPQEDRGSREGERGA